MLSSIEPLKSNFHFLLYNISSTKLSNNDAINLLNIPYLSKPVFVDSTTTSLPISDSSSGFIEQSSRLYEDTRETDKELEIVMKNPKSKKYFFNTKIKFTGKLKPHLILDNILIENIE